MRESAKPVGGVKMTARWIVDERPFGRVDTISPQGTGRGVVDTLLVVAVVTLMALSNYALEYFGIPYVSPTARSIPRSIPLLIFSGSRWHWLSSPIEILLSTR
jgi:hypothetical protein